MTDLDICKAIARIEGLIISNHSVDIDDLWVHTCNFKDSSVTFFNPLTDDALCFQLMVKYSIDLTHELKGSEYSRIEHSTIALLVAAI